MPIRFRKTFHILPGVKINLSRNGISTSIGPRGFHFTFGRGGIRQTVGLPGSGLSESSYLVKNEPKSEKEKGSEEGAHDNGEVGCFPWGCLVFILVVLVVGYFVANAMGWLPPHYLSHLLDQFMQWVHKTF